MARLTFVNVGFPHQLDYPEARPVLLALEQGHEVHAVSLADSHPGFPGVVHWREPSLFSMATRARTLKSHLTFFERPGRLLIAAAIAPNAWVRAPERVASPKKRRLQTIAMRRVAMVTFTNPYEATLWDVSPDRLRELPYPTDVAAWSQLPVRTDAFWVARGLGVPRRVVTCLANLMYRKQQLELLRWAAPLLREDRGLVLAFAGREYDAGISDRIQETANVYGVSQQVSLLGHLSTDEVRQLMSWTALHVVNSRNETQCMALYEALAAGVATTVFDNPVVTSAFPFLPRHHDGESFRSNATGLMASSGAGERQRELARPRLEWADTMNHDSAFLKVLGALS